MKVSEIEAVIESLLFISGDAVSITNISNTIKMDIATTEAIIISLKQKYERENRGMRIIEIDDCYQMATSPTCFEYIRDMYKSPVKKGLSQAILETLAIVAYKQPITKAQIEEIRGVNATHALSKLSEKELIYEVGRDNSAGHPILFGTTQEFLRYFGFENMEQLPKLPEKTIQDLDEDELFYVPYVNNEIKI